MFTIFASLLKALPKNIASTFVLLLQSVFRLLARWLRQLCRLFRCRDKEEEGERTKCLEIPPDVARRPDPCLYSQRYLAAQGIAVTWDNPDIVITNLDGTPAAYPLEADRDHLVRGTIHNASFDPALGVAVRSFVRSWGIDFEDRTPVEVDAGGQPAQRIVHIGAWGQADAVFKWRTPSVPGHYCVTVECFHPADREPANNVGQENTDVRRTAARGSTFTVFVPFFNRQKRTHAFRIAVDEYRTPTEKVGVRLEQIRGPNGIDEKQKRELLARLRLPEKALADKDTLRRIVQQDAMRGARIRLSPTGPRGARGVGYRVYGYHGAEALRAQNRAGGFPLAPGWEVGFPGLAQDAQGAQVQIPSGTTHNLEVTVRIPDTARPGERKQINLTAFDPAGRVVGGVTLDIEVEV